MGRQPDIQGEQDGAGIKNAVVGLEQAVAVHAEEGDAITGLHTRCAQSASEASGAFRKLSISEAQLAANDRSPARILLLGVAQTAQRCERYVHGV